MHGSVSSSLTVHTVPVLLLFTATDEFLGRAHLSLNHVRDEKPLTKTLFLSGRSTDNEQEVVMGNITLRVSDIRR